jgi:hypothetical protein
MKLQLSLLLACTLFAPRALVAQETVFTYQGRLNHGGSPANGQYEISFSLFDAVTNGTPVGTPVTIAPVPVSNGLFTATLDFGAAAFTGASRWLEFSVTVFGTDQPVVTLVPRQPITATPYALHAANAGGLMSFVDAPLDIKVNGQRAMRYQAALSPTEAPAIIGGYSGNTGASGATIAGGGSSAAPNSVLAAYGTVGGGAGNTAGAPSEPNTDHAWATIGGGLFNQTTGDYSTIGGGYHNFGTNEGTTIAGGFLNTASNNYATVGGGVYNFINGYGATIAGGGFNIIERGDASGSYSVIGGGNSNMTEGDDVTIAGGSSNHGSGDGATVGGGEGNTTHSRFGTAAGGRGNRVSGDFATIAGGEGNSAPGHHSFVGGGDFNNANGDWATMSGGVVNQAEGRYSAIGGGGGNWIVSDLGTIAGGQQNQIEGNFGSIGGGYYNIIRDNADACTIAGGWQNSIQTNADGSTISGGTGNTILSEGNGFTLNSTIAGGVGNQIEARCSTSTISGGESNSILHTMGATIGGGQRNTNSGYMATIPGGAMNRAEGNYSFAAGRRALALYAGTFVWADNTGSEFTSTNPNEFAVRATGGVRLVTAVNGNGTPTAGVTLATGSGTWSSLSDRHAKENFTPTNAREVLDKVAALPMTSWNYKTQEKSVRHLGPMAQDFHAAFGLGENDRTITTVDADGVALAAIQGLNAKLEEQIKARDARIAELESRLAGIEKLLATK